MMKDATKPVFKNTKLGILDIKEIEHIIFDNLILVQKYVYQNFDTISFSSETLCQLHSLLCDNIFDFAWTYRKHNVQVGLFDPINFVQVPIEMKILFDDITYRLPLLKTDEDKKEFLAYVMRKILWIHPFSDYNARVTRLFAELFMLKMELYVQSFVWTSRKDFAESMKKATFEGDLSDILKIIW